MEAAELMRLDWVCLEDDPTPRQVDFIRSGEVGLYWNKIVTPPYIKPVPLTPEILEKNGFEKKLTGDGIHHCFTLISDGIKFLLFYTRSVFQWFGPLDFKYVHELQHALKLCGIKKDIVL